MVLEHICLRVTELSSCSPGCQSRHLTSSSLGQQYWHLHHWSDHFSHGYHEKGISIASQQYGGHWFTAALNFRSVLGRASATGFLCAGDNSTIIGVTSQLLSLSCSYATMQTSTTLLPPRQLSNEQQAVEWHRRLWCSFISNYGETQVSLFSSPLISLHISSSFSPQLTSCNANVAQQLEQLAVFLTAILRRDDSLHEVCAEIQGDSRRISMAVRALNQVTKRQVESGHVSADDSSLVEEKGSEPCVPAELLVASPTPDTDETDSSTGEQDDSLSDSQTDML